MAEYIEKVVPNVAKTKQKIEKGSHLLVSLLGPGGYSLISAI